MDKKLNRKYIRNASKITSLNIATSDFTDSQLKYKNEIQHLFGTYFFPNFDLDKTIDTADQAKLNSAIDTLKRDPAMFQKLHYYPLKGVGPGEVTLYFLLNKAYLKGGSSAGVDVVVNNNKYEVKALQISRDGYAYGFELGRTIDLFEYINALLNLCQNNDILGSRIEIPSSSIASLKQKVPNEYSAIEKSFAATASRYFNHEVIIINNSPSNLGKIEKIGLINEKDIAIERVSRGVVRPKIKIR